MRSSWLALALLAGAAVPQEPGSLPIETAAARFLEAFRAGDQEKLRAHARAADPFHAANWLLGRHVDASLRDPPAPGDHLDAARALADLAGDPALVKLVAGWTQWGPAELQREAGLRRARDELRAARRSGQRDRFLERAQSVVELARSTPPTVTGVHLWLLAAQDLEQFGRTAEAETAFHEAADAAALLGWTDSELVAEERAAALLRSRGAAGEALELLRRQADRARETGRRPRLARSLRDQASILFDLGEFPRALEVAREARRLAEEMGNRADAARALLQESLLNAYLRDFELALQSCRRALHDLEEAGDREGSARARAYLGFFTFGLGLHDEAAELLQEAIPRLGRDGVTGPIVAWAWCWLGQTWTALYRFEEARSSLDRALQVATDERDRQTRATVLLALGKLHRELGETERALEVHRRAAAELEGLGRPAGVLSAQRELAWDHVAAHDPERAVEALERTRAAADRLSSPLIAGQVRGDLGWVKMGAGRYAEGLEDMEQALALQERAGLSDPSGRLMLARLLHQLGLDRRALAEAERGCREHRSRGQKLEAARAGTQVGEILTALGERARAVELLTESVRVLEATGDRRNASWAATALGNAHFESDRPEHARTWYERALELAKAAPQRSGEVAALANLGAALERLGRRADAVRTLEEAARLAEARGERQALSQVLHDLAAAQLADRRFAEARASARRSLELRSLLRTGLGEEESHGLLRQGRSAADIGVLAAHGGLAGAAGEEGRRLVAEAFWFAESARGLLLAERLVQRPREPASSREASGGYRAALTRLEAARKTLVGAGAGPPAAQQAARAGLDAAYAELELAVARLQRRTGRTGALAPARPAALDEVQASLPDGTAFVAYHLTSRAVLALVVTRSRASLTDLGGPAAIDAEADRWLRLVRVPGSRERDAARSLHDLLIRPLEGELGGARRLCLAPDGRLSFLPFEALATGGDGPGQRLVERWEVVYAPSGTIHRALAEEARTLPRGAGLVAVADPVYPGEGDDTGVVAFRDAHVLDLAALPRLPGTAREVETVAGFFPTDRRTVLTRKEATAAALEAALARAPGRLRAVHLACHGLLDDERPRLSGLVLAGGRVLTLDEVAALPLRADLAVLSACDTARGRLLEGEGVLGLTRAVLLAGASQVVVTDWRVADDGAQGLMTAFYRALVEDGLAPAAALRRAKVEALRAEGGRAHPFHWAAFVLWGGAGADAAPR
jgi:CHAT domain-containing protein/tetratricopeptide (TPR) repeat protein